jgi:LysM repeat protein
MGKRLWFSFILAFGLAACGGSGAQVTPEATLTLLYYHTPTPTSAESVPTLAVEPTKAPKATATPFVYTVVQNDTLSGIASRFGVTLEDLLAVNPNVDPNAMVIGTQLIIPGKEGETVSLQPAATSVPVKQFELRCYSTSAGGMWCFWLVQNDSGQPVENLAANITLYDQAGKPLRSETALGPLNLLRKGDQMPLVVYFTPPVPDWAEARADLQTSLPVSNVGQRYLAAEVEDLQVTVSEDGLWAQVTGGVRLEDGEAQASLVWVLATAYDAEGHVVGVRRWENEQGINAGKKRDFTINVYSLGPNIDYVELLVEARP